MSDAARKLPENPVFSPLKPVSCPNCGFKIFDGEVIRSRCVRIHTAEALCRCKAWVNISGNS